MSLRHKRGLSSVELIVALTVTIIVFLPFLHLAIKMIDLSKLIEDDIDGIFENRFIRMRIERVLLKGKVDLKSGESNKLTINPGYEGINSIEFKKMVNVETYEYRYMDIKQNLSNYSLQPSLGKINDLSGYTQYALLNGEKMFSRDRNIVEFHWYAGVDGRGSKFRTIYRVHGGGIINGDI